MSEPANDVHPHPAHPSAPDRPSRSRSIAGDDTEIELDIRKLPARYQFAFVAMKFFGFPLIVACALGWWIFHQEQNARADRESDRAAFVGALDSNTKELRELVNEIRRLEDSHR